MNYDYKEGRNRVISILKSEKNVKTLDRVPTIGKFTYENSFYSNVTALFVDIKDSTNLFGKHRHESTSKIIRAFTSEILEILNSGDNLREIGIRGDCVYAIYTYSLKEENYEIAKRAFYINTYLKMLNKMLLEKNMDTITAGIGVATSKELVIKVGKEGTKISNLVWIGEVVTHASKFSGIAGRDISDPIIFSNSFFNSVTNQLNSCKTLYDMSKPRKRHKAKNLGGYHSCDIKVKDFNEWIDGGMK